MDHNPEELERLASIGQPLDKAPSLSLGDFFAYLPLNKYIHRPTSSFWPAESLDNALPWPNIDGKQVKPSKWLAINSQIHQLVWSPGEPEVIKNKFIIEGGAKPHVGAKVFNLYRAPQAIQGDASDVEPWYRHLTKIYPDDWEHILLWFAQRIQHPEVKLNHALVLGGSQGIGKDTLIEPIIHGVGQWNFSEINPIQLMGRFNGWARSVIVRVSEGRDLGDIDRYAFYDHSKTYITSPPEVLRVDEKRVQEYAIMNRLALLITTNHKLDGLYLPPDDRRHYVAWSEVERQQLSSSYWQDIWAWYQNGGIGNVIAYLKGLDLRSFVPKAPPKHTAAFTAIVASNHSEEEMELVELLEKMGNPLVVNPKSISQEASTNGMHALAETFSSPRTAKKVAHQLDRAGYELYPNPEAKDRRWRRHGKRMTVYARKGTAMDQKAEALRFMGMDA